MATDPPKIIAAQPGRARSSASRRSGARAASTLMTSSRYRQAVDCGSTNQAPSRRISLLSRN